MLLGILVEELGWDELRSLWRRALEVTPPGIEIDSAGGSGEIPARVRRAVSDAAQAQRPVRHFVLMDSDRRWPTDNDAAIAKPMSNAIEECEKHAVPIHVWRKRSAENYIPDSVLVAVRDASESQKNIARFDALLRRSQEQRDHLPIKDALTLEERTKGLDVGFYKISDENDLILLGERLFPPRPRPFLQLHAERRSYFTAQGLRERDGKGELDDLLHAIAQEL
ncbi:MAG: hypothetical protein HC897_06885 [Thermoanaerobaculia bacterium]|nr:hypothetical protein [Thermoanaerobaculia bacterium]